VSYRTNTCKFLEKQHTCEGSNYRNFPVSATDGELSQTPSKAQIPEYSNKPNHTDTSIATAHCVKNQQHQRGSVRLPSDNNSPPEDSVITIIKNQQEAFW
jgi:hypothetical protein